MKSALGIDKRLYDFKHTGARMVIQRGATIKDLQLHMRHSDVKVTDEYLKAFQAQPSKEFQRMFPKL